MNKLKKYLVQVFTPGGHLEREVTEYGCDHQHVKNRLAEKFHRHQSHFVIVGEL